MGNAGQWQQKGSKIRDKRQWKGREEVERQRRSK